MSQSLLSGLLLLAVAATTAVADEPSPHKVTTKRDGGTVDVRAEKGKATFSIRSQTGIGLAVVERPGETWPDTVVLRLHLTGLESFKVTGGKTTLGGSVSLQDGKAVARLWTGGREDAPLDSESPYWMKVGFLGGDGKPAAGLPLEGGFFELPLPKALFEGQPKAVTVNWIDFYRN